MAKSPLLDFKKFKYVKSDDKSTTLQHAQGHTVNIVHGVLSKDNQAQLKAMADAAKQPVDKDPKNSPEESPDYGKVIMKADGGQVAQPDPDKAKAMSSTIKATDSDKAVSNAVKHPIDTLTKAMGFADGGEAQAPEALQSNDEYSKSHPQMPAININLGPGTQPIQAGPGAPIPETQPKAAPDTSTPMGKQQLMIDATRAGMTVPDYLKSINAPESVNVTPMEGQQNVINATRSGMTVPQYEQAVQAQHQEPAQGDSTTGDSAQSTEPVSQQQPQQNQAVHASAPKESADTHQPAIDDTQKPGDSFMNQVNAVKQDFDNGHITPKTYQSMFAEKSTLGKIGTIFGLIIGGAGAGLSGQKNALLDMMDKTISNDLEAQKNSKSNQMNFMQLAEQHLMNQANIQHLGAENTLAGAQAQHMNMETKTAAFALAQQYAMRSAFHELSAKTAAMPEGPAKQQAMQALGIMSQGIDMKAMQASDALNARAALTQGMMGAMGANPSDDQAFQAQQRQLRLTGHDDLAKDNESKYMPGLGRASTPLTGEDREKLRAGLQFGNELQRYAAFAKQHSGTIDPKIVGQGKALAAELQGAYRQATNGGVYKAGEQKFLENLVDSDPTKFFNNLRVMPKIDAIAREHDAKMHTLMKTYGFQGEMPKAASPEVKTLNGVRYQKAPGGWQKIQ